MALSPNEQALVVRHMALEWCCSSDSDFNSPVPPPVRSASCNRSISDSDQCHHKILTEMTDELQNKSDVNLSQHQVKSTATGGDSACLDAPLLIQYNPSILFNFWSKTCKWTVLYAPNKTGFCQELSDHICSTYILYRTLPLNELVGELDDLLYTTVAPVPTTRTLVRSRSIRRMLNEYDQMPKHNDAPVRSILKKRSITDTVLDTTSDPSCDEPVPSAATESKHKKGVHFDITGSMQYKHWRCGRVADLCIEAALEEVSGRGTDEEINGFVLKCVDDTNSNLPDLSILQIPPANDINCSLPLSHSEGLLPPSILKKRSRDEALDGTEETSANGVRTPERKKSVRFEDEVHIVSKERTGPYMSYKRRMAERAARMASRLQAVFQSFTAPATTTVISPVSIDTADTMDLPSYDDSITQSLGGGTVGTAQTNQIPADNTRSSMSWTYNPQAMTTSSQVNAPCGSEESDTESDNSLNSVEFDIAPPPVTQPLPRALSVPTVSPTMEQFAAKTCTVASETIDSTESTAMCNGEQDNRCCSVEPCTLFCAYDEFFCPPAATSSATQLSNSTACSTRCIDSNNENVNVSNFGKDDDSPFFDDIPYY